MIYRVALQATSEQATRFERGAERVFTTIRHHQQRASERQAGQAVCAAALCWRKMQTRCAPLKRMIAELEHRGMQRRRDASLRFRRAARGRGKAQANHGA